MLVLQAVFFSYSIVQAISGASCEVLYKLYNNINNLYLSYVFIFKALCSVFNIISATVLLYIFP